MNLILVFHNDDTGVPPLANYNVSVRINDRIIARSRFEGHIREHGWEELVGRWWDESTIKKLEPKL